MKEDLHDTMLARWLAGEISDAEVIAEIGEEEFAALKQAVEAAEGFEAPPFDAEASFAALDLQDDGKEAIGEAEPETPVRRLPGRVLWMTGLAAAAAIALVFLFVFQAGGPETITHMTAQGEQKEVELPDGSKVFMNAESELSYAANWSEKRELHLKGEAFFEVEKGKKFMVQTIQGSVEVLGTSFNVHARPARFQVGCYTGAVRVSDAKGQEIAELTPGKTVKQVGEAKPVQGAFKPEAPGWRDGVFSFNSVSFAEVIEEMERQFEVRIAYPDSMQDAVFTGKFNNEAMDMAIDVVATVFGMEWKKDGEKQIRLY